MSSARASFRTKQAHKVTVSLGSLTPFLSRTNKPRSPKPNLKTSRIPRIPLLSLLPYLSFSQPLRSKQARQNCCIASQPHGLPAPPAANSCMREIIIVARRRCQHPGLKNSLVIKVNIRIFFVPVRLNSPLFNFFPVPDHYIPACSYSPIPRVKQIPRKALRSS